MSRVAKRGIIEVPHRGIESVKNMNYNNHPKPPGALDEVWSFGTGHHKWLIEEHEIDNVKHLHFVPKIPYMLMRHPIPKWNGVGGLSTIWQGGIPWTVLYDIDEPTVDMDYARFRATNRKFWES